MEALSAAGSWLQQSLLDLCSNSHPAVIQLDADTVASLVSYCERAPPDDAKEYLSNMIGEDNCKDIISGYLQRRGTKAAVDEVGGVESDGMQVYIKPQMNEVWSAGSKKIIKNAKARIPENTGGSTVPESSNANGHLGLPSKSKAGVGRGKRTGKGVSLAEVAEGKMIMSQGAPCTCQATRHKLVNNCLSCGKIVCAQEGEGPCNFCGALVLVEGSKYAGLEGSYVPASELEAAAHAFKDRLVEYGRTSSQRTTVIDDQSDYFQVEESTWLSKEEKQAILKRQEEAQIAEEARKKKVVVSIDLIGRKVVMASDTDNDASMNTSILDGKHLERRSTDVRIKPNPYILSNPVFLKPKEMGLEGKNTNFGKWQSGMHLNDTFVKTGRVQHDDPFVHAFGSDTARGKDGVENIWKTPNVKGREDMRLYEDEKCLADCHVKEFELTPVFDICEPLKGKRISLSPTLLAQKQSQRALRSESSSSNAVLMQGVVLLKRWLSPSDQVDVVERCRKLGVGPGGFYQPGYGAESKMYLHMMCLGMHWEPLTRSYGKKRSIDNVLAPPIPSELEALVIQCLKDARHVLNDQNKSHDTERGVAMVPEMHPNICLINFYDRNGKLGMHQDKDESVESLKRGTPVVSFSIGDSAEFLYGVDRDKAQSVLLESGDALVFGGPSRGIYHGVASIVPQTAPSWLIEKTNLRPGRLNLTFRQF